MIIDRDKIEFLDKAGRGDLVDGRGERRGSIKSGAIREADLMEAAKARGGESPIESELTLDAVRRVYREARAKRNAAIVATRKGFRAASSHTNSASIREPSKGLFIGAESEVIASLNWPFEK